MGEPGPASVLVLVALGKEHSLAGWQPHSQTGQVSGCRVEPILPGEIKPLPNPGDRASE